MKSRASLRGRLLSSAEIERHYPHVTWIIHRGVWTFDETGYVNEEVQRIACDYRRGDFNSFFSYCFQRPEQASEMTELALGRSLHRLVPNSTQAATREEVTAEWSRIAEEREAILAWARSTKMLQHVVQEYRFQRRQGAPSYMSHLAAAEFIEKTDASVSDPANYAGVLIEWAEREHRDWFWRCCRDHHVL